MLRDRGNSGSMVGWLGWERGAGLDFLLEVELVVEIGMRIFLPKEDGSREVEMVRWWWCWVRDL